MTIVVVGSVAGSPGATTLAVGLAAAWPVAEHRRVVVEADPDGGRLGAELGVGVEPGLMALALASRSTTVTPDDLVVRGGAPVADWFVVPAPPSPEQAHSTLVHAASSLADVMADDPDRTMWFVDAGRISGRSPALPFAKAAAHVLVVTGGSFPSLQLVPHRVEALRAAGCDVDVVVVGPTSWPASEIADFVGADVVGVLPAVRSRASSITAMHTNPWRSWWAELDHIAAYLCADAPTPAPTALRIIDEVAEEVRP